MKLGAGTPAVAVKAAFSEFEDLVVHDLNSRVKLLWLGVGTAEPELFRAGIGAAVQSLKDAGVHVVYFESPGTAHEWQTWRRGLNDFVPRLFR